MNTAAKARTKLTATPPAEIRNAWARAIAATVFIAVALFTVVESRSMSGVMHLPGGWDMSMMWMRMPGQTAWGAAVMFLGMWLAMMIAMMLPSSWPMLELYQKVAVSSGERWPGAAVAMVAAGYFAVWLAFGALVFGMGFAASAEAMRSSTFGGAMPWLAASGLILSGVYQLSPWKQSCLRHCRSPLLFLGERFRPGLRGALRTGVAHGLFCTGCCWALMVMQAILGVMNLAVMILIAAVIGAEKLWARGPWLARVTGWASIAAGAYFLLHARG